jgi:hypothetical protein
MLVCRDVEIEDTAENQRRDRWDHIRKDTAGDQL